MAGRGGEVARALLRSSEEVRASTRGARRARWFPLVTFGVLVLGALPFYRAPASPCPAGATACFAASGPAPLGLVLGPQGVAASLADWATIYWLAAIATGLVACLSFSRYRSRRSGVGRRAWPVLAAGAVVLALAILDAPVVLARLSPSPGDVPSGLAVADLHIRGLTSLLVLAAVVLALGLAERSGALAGFGVVFFAVTVVANLYDLDNLLARVGWTLGPSTVAMANVAIPGVVLLAGGALFAVLDRRPRTARTDPGGLARG